MQVPLEPLGRTGLSVSRMGLGLAALGRPGYINLGHAEDLAYDYVVEAMERRTHRLLNTAYEQGIRYFDVARSYGRAETFLKSWLDEHQPQDVIVASKWGYSYTADWEVETDVHEVKDHSLDTFRRQWEASSQLLPQLRIYQIHSATFESGVLENRNVLEAMSKLKVQGVKVGLTLSGEQQAEVLKKALEIEVDGLALFDVVQATFNVLEQSIGPTLKDAAAKGLGIVVKEALANGRLTRRNQDTELNPVLEPLKVQATQRGIGMDAIALAFVLAQPWSHVVLSGAAVENHLLSNLDALKLDLSADELEQMENMAQDRERYWKTRAGMAWN
jgi:aryl-alcohol dehydrogenase-like predicted oxidoreductase